MKKKLTVIFSALMVVAVAFGAFGTSVASAYGGGPGDRNTRLSDEAIAAVADLLGMTADELTTAIKEDGKTIQELADEAGVDMQDVKDVLAEFKGERTRNLKMDDESIAVVADLLGMSADELTTAVQDDGKTIQELADEAGVDMQDIKDALSALRSENTRDRIETALDQGDLTQDEANWLLEGLDNGYLAKLGKWFMKRGGKR